MANHYDIPKWAGKPAVGLHLDVAKGDKLIQKLMIDEKKCYLFGRNPQMNDFCIDHGSCSRVHAVLVYHKALNISFLVDLGSTHGTHIGKIRLEPNKPTQCPVNSTFHFGASTRMYTLRERPQTAPKPVMEELERMQTEDGGDGALLGLPETETELENLTEFNTAHNRRISMLGIEEDESRPRKRHKFNISFKDDEDVINPEDVDPSIGRFRNLLQTTVVPNKRKRIDAPSGSSSSIGGRSVVQRTSKEFATSASLYDDLPPDAHHSSHHHASSTLFSSFLTSKLGLPMPNPAPEVELQPPEPTPVEVAPAVVPGVPAPPAAGAPGEDPNEPKKKKYAKEAWPGRKPNPLLV